MLQGGARRMASRACAARAATRWMTTVTESGAPGGAPTAAPESNFSRYAGIAFFSVIVAGTATLGAWQTQRYYWKVDVIEERKKQLLLNLVDLPAHATAYSELDVPEFCQLRVEGRFKSGSTFYLYPRSAPAESTDSVATPKSGGYIYSLLERKNGSPVIINRGWLPRKLLDQHIAQEKKEDDGSVTILGVMRHGETKNQFTPDNDISKRQFFYLNHDELADAMEVDESILPVILDATAEETEMITPSLDTFVRKKLSTYLEFYMTPEKHAGYAATWYSFSVAAALMAYFRFRKPIVRAPVMVRKRRS